MLTKLALFTLLSLTLSSCASAAASVEAQVSTPLEGTVWRLTRLHDQAIVPAGSPRDAQIQLLADKNQVVGSTGCNRLSGGYKRSGNQLSFTPFTMTRMACPDIGDLETRFVNALAQASSYGVDGKVLELLDKAGTTLARFEPAPPGPSPDSVV